MKSPKIKDNSTEQGRRYAKKRVEFAEVVGTPKAEALLSEIEGIHNELFADSQIEKEPVPVNDNLLKDISKWLVSEMIDCCFHNNFKSIGEGTDEEIQAAFAILIGNYHEACQSEHVSSYLKIATQIRLIEFKWKVLNGIAEIMTTRYCKAGAATLMSYYPQYEFSETSFIEDLQKVRTSEISNEIKYERLCKELEKLDKSQKEEKEYTPQQRHANFLNRLAEINKYEGTRYKENETTVLQLAVLETRLNQYIESIEEQLRNNGGAN